jgi:DNA-binding IclR family transcriptional regulator
MSRMHPRDVDKIYRYTRHYGLGGEDLPSFETLIREVRWTREVGHAYIPKRPTPEVSSIAMPLDENLYGTPLAIGVDGLADRIARAKQDILDIMHEAIAAFKERQHTEDERGFVGMLDAA